ncbi:MAG: S1 RNA-binding domain-containing protein, partial [Gemmatimonadetes bacterium]|nr:S1 RNA-binding domain-containing protein [Gemmatimonadota bacterium]
MADRFIDSPSEVLQDGQEVDFVLIKHDPKGWKASISAVTEAKARTALSSLNEGDRLKGKIVDFKDRGVILDSGAFRVWLPIAELDWGWIDHPSEVVALGDEVEAKITRVRLPEGWLTDRRQRRAGAIGSLRACLPQPESPKIPIAFSSLPFKVWAIAKTPRSCDPVVLYILEDLV